MYFGLVGSVVTRFSKLGLLFAMTSKSKIGYYFQQAAKQGKEAPRESDQNESSKSASTATERETVL